MSKYPKADPSRWNSADPADVTKLAQRSIDVDMAALYDWYWQCKRMYPGVFQGWSIEQFKNWNDKRIADLIEPEPAPAEDYDQALTAIRKNCGHTAGWMLALLAYYEMGAPLY